MRKQARLARMLTVLNLGASLLAAGCGAARPSPTHPLPPGLTVEFREEFYGFTAATPEEAAAAMRDSGPEVRGERVPGATQLDISWDYQVVRSGTDCRMHTVEVRVIITTTLPRWLNLSAAPAALQEQWASFEDAVEQHENRHRDINLAGARDVLEKLKSIGPRSCVELAREAAARGEASLREHDDRNTEFDRDTRGGQTQGVIWPPSRETRA